MIEVRLPVPPSVNALYLNRKRGSGRGRIKSKIYRAWLLQADAWFLMQKRGLKASRLDGRLKIEILIPATTRGDASNRIKASEDFLVSRQITGDDKNNWEVSVRKEEIADGCIIRIWPISGT